MMPRLTVGAKRHPLVTFFVLAYALSWWPSILYVLDLSPQPVAGFGPFLAAVAVLAVTRGKSGIGGLLRRMVYWRVEPRWYAAALLIPVGLATIATTLNVLLGARAPSAIELDGWTGLFSTFAILLLVPGIGGAWEEPGWRGFALPRLQGGRSALLAGLILGVLIAGWHLPLVVTGEVHSADLASIMGATLVLNWVFNSASGSVLILMMMHATNNAVSGGFFSPMFSGADSMRQSWLLAAVWCGAAIAVVLWAGPAHLSRRRRKQEEPPQGVPVATTVSQAQGVEEVLK
jgi:membrane protease YdiL (CAAX protease family)